MEAVRCGFRELFAEDAGFAYFDPDLFAETHTLDGEDIVCVVAESAASQSMRVGRDLEYYPTLPDRDIIVWARTRDIPEEIVMDGSCELDGELCTVMARKGRSRRRDQDGACPQRLLMGERWLKASSPPMDSKKPCASSAEPCPTRLRRR